MRTYRWRAFGLALFPLLLAASLQAQPAPDASGAGPAAAEPQAAPAEQPPERASESPAAETAPAAAEVEKAPPAAGGESAPSAAPAQAEAPSAPATPTGPAQTAEPIPAAAPPNPRDVTLTIASRGGAYQKAQELAQFRPFGTRKGYRVTPEIFDGSLAALRAQQGSPRWDVVDLDQATLARACEEGLLERLDASLVEPAPDGAPASEDFLPGGIQPCGIASSVWSAVIMHDRDMKTPPTKAEHLFDVRRYPGKRAFPRMPQYTLETALMADGVPPAEVYAQLATKEGQDRAFAKLTSIKDHIVWWDKAAQATEIIGQKQVAMGLAFNGRAFMAIVKDRQPLRILWDHQIYQLSYWAVPNGARHSAAAREFIAFATATGPLADQTRWMPYGPARASAMRLAGKHAEIDMDMRPYLPTHKPNLESALAFDGVWWAANEPGLKERFAAWQEGRDVPPGEAPRSQ